MKIEEAIKKVGFLTDAQRSELGDLHFRYMCFAGITTRDDASEIQAEADRAKFGHLLKFKEDGTPILSGRSAAEFMSSISGLAREVCEAWDAVDFHDTHGNSDGSSQIVKANLEPIGTKDADKPVFHILPQLLVPASLVNAIKLKDITLTIRSSLQDKGIVNFMPEGEVIMRQPYPNRRYFVAGSSLTRNGWLVSIPADLKTFDIQFEWHIHTAKVSNLIQHNLAITLEPGKGQTYSMDSVNWVTREAAPCDTNPTTPFLVAELKDAVHRKVTGISEIIDSTGKTHKVEFGQKFKEAVTIIGVPLEQAYSLSMFEEEQLHEVQQTADLPINGDTLEHRRNAPIEMPRDVFVRAVRLAQRVLVGDLVGTLFGLENHPAVEALCEWWNTSQAKENKFPAGIFMIYARVRDDGEYWSGNPEEPNAAVNGFNKSGKDAARIGDNLLISFGASQKHAIFYESGMNLFTPSGGYFTNIGVTKEKVEERLHDEALYALEALQEFPTRFPKVWENISKVNK